jgi:Mlc titration factor MtfA (ptsG expression regulator)
MFGWLRRRRPAPTIPLPLWQRTLADYPFLTRHDAGGRLQRLAEGFLAAKQFHGAQGFAITDEVAVAIAAQAVVHPQEVVARRTDVDEDGVVHDWEEVLAGEAMHRGPIMLSWQDVREAGRSAEQGYNVVIHEFVHKLDMRDGASDGCPPLPSRQARGHWLQVLGAAYEAFRERTVIAERFGGEPTWLDPYGATSVDEFFAVASEAYFTNRPRFDQEFPTLGPLFDGFYLAR